MIKEDDEYVLKGSEPLAATPTVSLGRFIYEKLINCQQHDALINAHTGEVKTNFDILYQSCQLAQALRLRGYNKGSILSICSENCLQFPIPVIASLFIGVTVAPLSHMYTLTELRHALNITKTKLVFCSKAVADKFNEMKENGNLIKDVIIIDSDISLQKFIEDSLGNRRISPKEFMPFDGDPSELLAFVMYSSGTTGLPKGVMLSHLNLLKLFDRWVDPRQCPLKPEHNVLGVVPFFHAYGLFTLLGCIVFGFKMIFMARFEEDLFLATIEKYKITNLWLVPPIIIFLAKSPKVDKYDLSSVVEVGCGAASIKKDIIETFKKRLGLKYVRQGYGLTETVLGVMTTPVNEEKLGSCGKLAPRLLCKIRDPETGKSLPSNQVGEICVKGQQIMLGYYGDENATKEAFTSDGWLKTGDLGYYDEEEWFFIVDRLKELIKYKGYQVAPAELESLLINHPKITDAGVIGLPDELAGELPVGFVVKKEGSTLSEEDVQTYLSGLVSSHKRLRGGVIFVAAIPKNATGKILRRELKKMLINRKSKL